MKKLMLMVIGLILSSTTVMADPEIRCTVSRSPDSASFVGLTFLGTNGVNNISKATKVVVDRYTTTRNPDYVDDGDGWISNTDPQPYFTTYAPRVIAPVAAASSGVDSVSLTFSPDGALSILFLSDSKVNIMLDEPLGPELGEILDDCSIAFPEAGFTVGN